MKDASPSLREDDPPMTLEEALAICTMHSPVPPRVWNLAQEVVRIAGSNAADRIAGELKGGRHG